MKKLTVNLENKYLEIEGVYPSSNQGYIIHFHQLSVGKKQWVEHLREKNWWDESLEEQFSNAYEKVCQKQG